MKQILLIDDDSKLGKLLAEYFISFNFQITQCLVPSEGFKKLDKEKFDLVVLDIMLPEMDGFEVCKRIRKHSEIPVLMLTARGEVTDRIVGIEIGADDYLPKPFEPRELVVRIQSILKRVEKREIQKNLNFSRIEINPSERKIAIDNHEIELSGMEFDLVVLMAKNKSHVFTRDEIISHIKGIDAEIYSRSVDILVSRLRQKLKPLDCIKTIRGAGYAFVAE